MDNEKLHGVELNDSDLDQIWGGQGGKDGPKKCPVYQSKKKYTSCPVPDMGLLKQCSGCELNVV